MTLKHPKAKGTRLENEVLEDFKAVNLSGTRCWGSDGRSRGLPKEVDVVIEGYDDFRGESVSPLHIQCKSVAKLSQKFKPADCINATIYKENRGEKYIIMKLDYFLKRYI